MMSLFRRIKTTFGVHGREAKPLALCTDEELFDELVGRCDSVVICTSRRQKFSIRVSGSYLSCLGLLSRATNLTQAEVDRSKR